jgi:hypothetical protein
LDKLGGVLPTLKHGKAVVRGASDCIEYIDRNIGDKKDIFFPQKAIQIKLTNCVFDFLNQKLKPHFYSMLLF